MPSAGGRQSGAGRLARHWTALARHWHGAGTALARHWHGAGTALARHWHGTGTEKKCRRTDRHAVRRLSEYSRAASKSARALSRTFTQPECGAARARMSARRCAAAPLRTRRCAAMPRAPRERFCCALDECAERLAPAPVAGRAGTRGTGRGRDGTGRGRALCARRRCARPPAFGRVPWTAPERRNACNARQAAEYR